MIEIGGRVGEALIEERIGEGATSTVWRATWRGRTVVVKVPHAAQAASDEFLKRMKREAAALRSIRSENVVQMLDVGQTDDGMPYVLLEHVDGPTLRPFVGHENVTPTIAARWLDQLAHALELAHEAGVVHRDVKPENVMIEDDVVKLVDFGLAKPQDDVAKLTTTGTPLGTPAYMAPEQWWNEDVGPAADQYAFGVVAYELVAGAHPFPVSTLPDLMEAHLHREPPPIPGAPPAVSACLSRMLAKKASDRYPSMSEARVALREALGGTKPSRLPIVLPWILLVTLPIALLGLGYPGARDPRESFVLAGWSIYSVWIVYFVGAYFLRRSWFAPMGPAIFGTFATYTGWQTVLGHVETIAAADRVPVLHQGLYEANVNRFIGLGLTAALFFALAATFEGKTLRDLTRRALAIILGMVFVAGTLAIRMSSSIDLLWTGDQPRAARVAALLAAGALRARLAPPVVAAITTLALVLVFVTLRRFREGRQYVATWRSIARGPALVLAVWFGIDVAMLRNLRNHITSVVHSQAGELDLMSQLDPPSADGLPPAPMGPAIKIARDRVLVDDAPVGLTSALERGGLDEVLRADLSHRLARDDDGGHLLVVLADRSVSTAAVTRALDVARSVGVTEVALLYTRGPSPAIDSSSEAAATLPSDFGALRVPLDGLTLEGARYEDAANALSTRTARD